MTIDTSAATPTLTLQSLELGASLRVVIVGRQCSPQDGAMEVHRYVTADCGSVDDDGDLWEV